MMRKFMTFVATALFAVATLTPMEASAQRRHHGGWGTDYAGCRPDNNYGCERDRDRREAHNGYNRYGYGYGGDYYDRRHDDDDDAIAAGVIGLVLGAVVGAAIADSNNRSDDRYDDRYDDRGYSDYDRQYAPTPAPQCRERRWDRYANRYVMVDVPC